MRYQRVSPDIIPLCNGSRKPSLKSFKDDGTATTAEGKTLRARSVLGSANPSPNRDDRFPQISFPSEPFTASFAITAEVSQANNCDTGTAAVNVGIGAEGLFRWAHGKRSRGSRNASSTGTGGDEPSHQKRPGKIPRRTAIAAAEKMASMPPPSCAGGFYTRGSNLRSSLPAQIAIRFMAVKQQSAKQSAINTVLPFLFQREQYQSYKQLSTWSIEDRSVGLSRSDKRSPASPLEKAQKMPASGGADFSMNPDSKQQPSDQETGCSGPSITAAEKLNIDHLEWPRIYLSLSRKEKEEDFLAMKGTKLPQRPKKRAKNIDKALQFCFPGTWLADLTRGRYEVREKKCAKKKRRGLKGMESMDSDSE